MEKFATLEPVRLYGKRKPATPIAPSLVGRLPSDLHLLVLSHLPIPDLPAYVRCSHSTAALAQIDSVWESRWKALAIDTHGLAKVLDDLESRFQDQTAASRASVPPTIPVDDEFGDFASGADVLIAPPEEMGDFVGAFSNVSVTSPRLPPKDTFRSKYIRAHALLRQLAHALTSPPHLILTALSSAVKQQSLRQEAKTLRLLSLFLSPAVQPLRAWPALSQSLRSAIDRFDANLLAAFDVADGKGDESGMREAAESSWGVWDGQGDWEMGKVWAEKREVFYQQGKWRPLGNFT